MAVWLPAPGGVARELADLTGPWPAMREPEKRGQSIAKQRGTGVKCDGQRSSGAGNVTLKGVVGCGCAAWGTLLLALVFFLNFLEGSANELSALFIVSGAADAIHVLAEETAHFVLGTIGKGFIPLPIFLGGATHL